MEIAEQNDLTNREGQGVDNMSNKRRNQRCKQIIETIPICFQLIFKNHNRDEITPHFWND